MPCQILGTREWICMFPACSPQQLPLGPLGSADLSVSEVLHQIQLDVARTFPAIPARSGDFGEQTCWDVLDVGDD